MTNISLPSLAAGLRIAESQAVWISTTYQLVCAATLMVASALSYILGSKRVYLAGLLLFTLGSLGSALAPDFAVMMGCRVLQGAGAAALLALGPALLRTIYPPNRLGRAVALNALVVAGGLAAGPSLGGIVLFFADWRWIFALNLPVGLMAIWLTQDSFTAESLRKSRFDWQGALYSALVMAALMLALERLGHGSGAVFPAVLTALAVIFSVLFVYRQRKAPQPLLPLEIFSQTRFSLSIITTLLAFTAQGLVFVTLSFLYQSQFNFSPLKAALLFAPWPVSLLLSGPLAGRLSDRINPALLSSVGLLAFLSGLTVLAWGSHVQSLPALVTGSLWCGLGYGFFQAPNNHEIMTNAPIALSSTASGVLATVRTLGQSFGSAAFAFAWAFYGRRIDLTLWVAFAFTLVALASSTARLKYGRGSPVPDTPINGGTVPECQ
ncbi:hypothetical protein BG841_05825 [Marinobacter sp. X15-166B]|nr:hypothetical protein BG841_05825 [Marinobacter sp. X15-166B]